MMLGRYLCLPLALTASCIVQPIEQVTDTSTNDSTQVDQDTQKPKDTGAQDTGSTVDSNAIDTGWGDSDTNSGGTGHTPSSTACHPYMPVATGNWMRKYTVTQGAKSGTETHAGLGPIASITTGAGAFPASTWATANLFGYTVSTKFGRNADPLVTYFVDCVAAGNGKHAINVGYKVANKQKPSKPHFIGYTTNNDVFLPSASELTSGLGYASTGVMVKQKVLNAEYGLAMGCQSFCWHYTTYNITVDTSVTSLPSELVSYGPLSNVTAQKLTIISHMTVRKQGSGNPFFDLWGAAFGGIGNVYKNAGYKESTGGVLDAQITRWYVEGVGLVHEEAYDISTQAKIGERSLTNCRGLPGCP